jgi:hypothetical protein
VEFFLGLEEAGVVAVRRDTQVIRRVVVTDVGVKNRRRDIRPYLRLGRTALVSLARYLPQSHVCSFVGWAKAEAD